MVSHGAPVMSKRRCRRKMISRRKRHTERAHIQARQFILRYDSILKSFDFAAERAGRAASMRLAPLQEELSLLWPRLPRQRAGSFLCCGELLFRIFASEGGACPRKRLTAPFAAHPCRKSESPPPPHLVLQPCPPKRRRSMPSRPLALPQKKTDDSRLSAGAATAEARSPDR
mgnify:CR=1 FL=1